MELTFEVANGEHENAFRELLASDISEDVLLALVCRMSIDDTIVLEDRRGNVPYELAKVYQKTICEGERRLWLRKNGGEWTGHSNGACKTISGLVRGIGRCVDEYISFFYSG